MNIKSTCAICGNTYMKRNGKTKYCSPECRKEATRRRQEQWRKEHPDYHMNWHKEHPEYNNEWLSNHPHYGRDRSRQNRNSKVEKRACIICGKEFETAIKHKTTCSDQCKAERRRRYDSEQRQRSAEKEHDRYIKRKYGSEEKRQEYLKSIEKAKAKEREKKRAERKKQKEVEKLARIRIGQCVVCGTEYRTFNPSQKTCSKKCGKTLAYSRKQKRIPKKQIVDKDITLEALYRRDSGVCYLCGKSCDWNDKQENIVGPSYPSIDHIIPVSRGGLHAWNNVRLAHFSCNVDKSDAIIGDAEKLIPDNAYEFKKAVLPQWKVVSQYTKAGEFIQQFPSTAEAERKTGINCKGIQACAQGRAKSSKGYVWRYEA